MAEPLVKVYYAKPVLQDVSRVMACLYEKQIDFTPIDIYEGQQSVPMDFLKLQSKASTRVHGPPFEDGETKLFESRAICRYLVEKYAGRGNKMLLGRDPLERASIEQWLKTEEHSFDPPSWTLVFYLAFAPAMGLQPDRRAMEESEKKLSEVLDVYEQRLAGSSFLAGNEFTLADLSHLPNSHYLKRQELFTSRKNVSRWLTDISNRDSWRKVAEFLNKVPVERVPVLAGAVDGGDRPPPPARPQLSQAVQSPVQSASPGQPVQSPTDASKSTPVTATPQPEGPVVEGPPPPAQSQLQQATHSPVQPASPAQPVQSPTDTAKSTPVSATTQPEVSGVQRSSPPAQSQLPHAAQSPVPPASPRQPAQPPTNASKSTLVKATTQPEGQTTTVQAPPPQKIEMPAPPSSSSQQEDKSVTQSVPTQVSTQANGTQSAGSSASSNVSSPKQDTNGEKSGPLSTKDTSPKTTKTMAHESTLSGSNATPAMQASSEQIARQPAMGTNHAGSTKTGSTQQATSLPTPGKDVSSPKQATSDEKSVPQSTKDTSQKDTKTMEHESTQSGSNAIPAKQDGSEQTVRPLTFGTDHDGSTKMGATPQATSQAPPGKDVSSPKQGTGVEKSSPQSTKDTSQKDTKIMEHESTQSNSNAIHAMQASSEQIAPKPTMGTDHDGSIRTGAAQQANSQTTPGKAPKDTSQKDTKTMEHGSTQSRSNAIPAVHASSEQIARQPTVRTDHADSTKIGATSEATSQITPERDISSPEEGRSGEKSNPQSSKESS